MTHDLAKLSESDIEITTAQPTDLDQLHQLATVLEASQALAQHLGRPRYQPAFTRIVRAVGEICGGVLIGHTRLQLGPATLDAGLIQAVLLHESAQQASIVAAITGDVLAVLAEHSIPVALVPQGRAAFAKFGFAPFQPLVASAGWQANVSAAGLRPLVANDLEDCAALYEATYRTLPWSEVRTAADWRTWLDRVGETNALADSQGRLVAYAVRSGPVVTELAAADAGAAQALLNQLPAMQLALPFAHRATQAALWMGATVTVQLPPPVAADTAFAASLRGALAGIVDLTLVLQQLAPVLHERLANSRYNGWQGSIQLETAYETVQLMCAANQFSICAATSAADLRLRRVTLHALAQLCLGARAIAGLRASGELDCDDTALGLLDILFPVLA